MVQATKITGVIETISQSCVLELDWKLHERTNREQDREQIIHEWPHKVPHNPPEWALRDFEGGFDALVYVYRVEQDHIRRADSNICARADEHPCVGLHEGGNVVCSVSDEHYVGLVFGSLSGIGMPPFLDGPNKIGL